MKKNKQSVTNNIMCYNVCKFILTSPIGEIEILSCSEGLHSVSTTDKDDSSFAPDEKIPVLVKPNTSNIAECGPAQKAYLWLKNFFSLSLSSTETDIPPLCKSVFKSDTFCSQVLHLLPLVAPLGTTITYKDLAQACGNPKACRAVGHAMSSNPFPLIIPCHRVVCSNGDVGNYSQGRRNKVKQWLLNFEKDFRNLKP